MSEHVCVRAREANRNSTHPTSQPAKFSAPFFPSRAGRHNYPEDSCRDPRFGNKPYLDPLTPRRSDPAASRARNPVPGHLAFILRDLQEDGPNIPSRLYYNSNL